MTEFRPYNAPPRSAPLTAGARFIRGFKRIGIVAAGLVFIAGVAISVAIAIHQQRSANNREGHQALEQQRHYEVARVQLFFLGVAILIQAECQRLRYRPRNGPLMQRGSAMLILYLTPWVVFRVCMASPLPEVFPVPRSKSAPKVLEPTPPPARLIA